MTQAQDMNLREKIRHVLREAAGPLKTTEITELVGLIGINKGSRIWSALGAMLRAGEVEKIVVKQPAVTTYHNKARSRMVPIATWKLR